MNFIQYVPVTLNATGGLVPVMRVFFLLSFSLDNEKEVLNYNILGVKSGENLVQ